MSYWSPTGASAWRFAISSCCLEQYCVVYIHRTGSISWCTIACICCVASHGYQLHSSRDHGIARSLLFIGTRSFYRGRHVSNDLMILFAESEAWQASRRWNTSEEGVVKQWQISSEKIRASLGLSRAWSGWTSQPDFVGHGLVLNPRSKDLLNICFGAHLRKAGLALWLSQEAKDSVQELYLDVSQGVQREPWNRAGGEAPCLTTSTALYAFGKDRLVCPQELARMMGWPDQFEVPAMVSPQKLRQMIGNGIALPCLGTILLTWNIVRMSNSQTQFL